MIRLSYDEIVGRIKEKNGMNDLQIAAIVDKKMAQLAGLISKEGAAHIVASELGIKLVDQLSGRLQIKNILTGMRDVEIVAKVLQIFEERQFNSNGREGKVASMQIADETGGVRVVLWNDQADHLKTIKIGDIIKIKGAYVKERNNSKELHVSDRSAILLNPPGENIDVKIPETQSQPKTAARKKLSELTEADSSAEVVGTVVQVFDVKFFEVCPECGKRARPSENSFACTEHGIVSPAYSYVMNVIIDDGTENMRLVLFRRAVEKILNKTEQELLSYKAQPDLFQQVKNDLLGSFVKASVRVNKNEMFNRIELVVQEITEANPDDEITRLNDELAAKEFKKAE
jgi:replication factor A1